MAYEERVWTYLRQYGLSLLARTVNPMVANRLADIFTLMEKYDRDLAPGRSLCRVAAEITELDGASISLSSSVDGVTNFCASDGLARSLTDLEITLGEGPGMNAILSDETVSEPDLYHSARGRWPLYSPAAIDLGARAVFGLPVRVGAIRFGALSLYRLSPGPLSGSQASDAYLMASVVARSVLSMQAGASDGELLDEFRGGATLDFRVHQAAGMLAVQGSLTVKDALVALRSHAFSSDTELSTLAERVVTRRTRFDPTAGEWVDSPENVA
jgi:hypothetical protein